MRVPVKKQPQTFRMHSRYERHARRDAVRHESLRPVAPSPRARIERVRRETLAREMAHQA
jgi:hypothetical protein